MTKIPSISLIPSGVKAGKIYSVLPIDGSGDFTFDRGNGNSTRINKQKLIEGVSNDVPRLDYGISDCPALLLEPSRTNLLTYSETFSNSSWTKSGASVVGDFASPSADSPSGAFALTSTGTGQIQAALFGQTAGVEYTVSFWIKRKTGTGVVNLRAVENTSTPITITNEWARYSATVTSSSTTVRAGVRLDTVGDEIYIFGAQLEVGSYASSYIPTSGSSQTRQVESNEVTTGLEDKIGQTEGVFYVDFEYLYQTTTDASTDSQRDLTVLGNTTDLSEFVFFDNYRGVFRVAIDGSGMTYQSLGSTDAGSAQANTRYKLAIKYKSGDSKAYLNGLLLGAVGTATINFAVDLNGIFFSYNNSSRSFKNQKKVYDLKVYKTGLSDAELETLTSYISFNAMALALNYKLQ